MQTQTRMVLTLLVAASAQLGCFKAVKASSSSTSGSAASASSSGVTSGSSGSTASASASSGSSSGSSGSSSSSAGSSGTASSSGSSTGSSGSSAPTGLEVTPVVATAAVGTRVAFVATATYADGSTRDVTQTAAWSSPAPAVATVSAGVATALAAGSTQVTAQLGALSASAALTVSGATLTSIAITPPNPTTGLQGSVALQATATLSDGTTQDVTGSATWASASPAVASVSSLGVAQGLGAGSAVISATVGSVTGQTTLTVMGATLASIALTPSQPSVAAGLHLAFSATATYSDGSIADVTATATWASSNPAAVSVAAGGQAVALAPGSSTVSATVGQVVGSTAVTVSTATLQSVVVSPATAEVSVGGSKALTALGTFSDGSSADITTSAVWSSSAPGVAAVSNAANTQGQVTGVGAGTATITAALDGVSGVAALTVTAATLTALEVQPGTASTPLGVAVAFTAYGTYSDGSRLDVTAQVAWSSSDSGVATVSNASGSQGLATPVAPGSATLTALLGGSTATASLTVTAATLTALAISPSSPSTQVGDRLALSATGTYSDGSTALLTAQVVWSSSDTAVATVSNASGANGQLTAIAPGSATLTATSGSISGSATVTVASPTLSQVVVSPATASVRLGGRVAFTATAIYSNNTSRGVTGQAQWSSRDTSVATVGSNGMQAGSVTPVAVGSTTITATYQGLSGSAALSVTQAVPVSVQVTPIQPSYPAGTTAAMTATVIYSDGTSQDVTPQSTWVSSAPSTVAVSTGGGGPGGPGGGGQNVGAITCLQAGSATITATYQGLSGATTVTVTSAVPVSLGVYPASVSLAAGATAQLSAQLIYSDNTSQDVTQQATWSSSNASVAGVDTARARGGLTAIAAGSATITATYQGLSATASVTVTAATLSAIALTPAQPSVPAGTTLNFVATGIYSDNTSQNLTQAVTWTSSTTSVAAISDARGSKGQTQALSAGTSTITASYQGLSGTAALTVTGATLQAIQVTPFSPTLPVGFATAFQATGLYSDNTTQDLTALATWVSSDSSVAAVSTSGASRGQVSPLAAGSATITATYQGVTGSDAVTVTSATLQSIAISPAAPALAVGASLALSAQGTFSDGSTLDVTGFVTWLSSDTSVANVSNASGSKGRATAFAAGTTTVTAVRGGVSGSAPLSVSGP